MKTNAKCVLIIGAAILITNLLLGCSNSGGNPAVPNNEPPVPVYGLTPEASQTAPSHVLWGMWSIHLDLGNQAVTVEPLRETETHYNVTDMLLPPACDDCIKIKINSFDPITRILDADVTLRNPTKLTGYDVRGILYTNDYGLELRNADDWTPLYDIPGGQQINPFMAFADQGYRKFAGEAEYTKEYLIYIPQPPHLEAITYAVDASYPDNCKEPYEITNFWQETIECPVGSSGDIYVDVRDWQGDVNKVTLVAPKITGESFTQFSHLVGDTWKLNLKNNEGVGPAKYTVRIIANSTGSGQTTLQDYIVITIIGIPENPVDVTPPRLNCFPLEFCIDGNYAYAACGGAGIHIFDISNPLNPIWLNWVDTVGSACAIAVSNGYAFVANWYKPFQIIDIDPPESAHIVKTIEGFDGPTDEVAVSGEYVYVLSSGGGIYIIKAAPPEEAYIVKTIQTGGNGLVVSGGYAFVSVYCAYWSPGLLKIIDIDPPEEASVVKTVETTSHYPSDIGVYDGYAYVSTDGGDDPGLEIFDIDPPEDAYFVKTIDVEGLQAKVKVEDGYAYLVTWQEGIQIIDIDPLESAYVVNKITTWAPESVTVSGGYAYVACGKVGFQVVDVNPPESANITKSVEMPVNALQVALSDGYAFVLFKDNTYNHWVRGLHVVNIDPLPDAHICKTVYMDWDVGCVAIYEGYAYVTRLEKGIQVLDISPPESTNIVNTVVTPYPAYGIEVFNGKAFVTSGEGGIQVLDLTTPESPKITAVFNVPGGAYDLTLYGGYAYVASGTIGLHIITLDPFGSPYIIKTIDTPGEAWGVAVAGGYAYVACNLSGLQIIDIDPPESAYIVNCVDTTEQNNQAIRIAVSGGYAYLAMFNDGVEIIDIDPPESAYIKMTIRAPYLHPHDIKLFGNYAYVPDYEGGLRVIKLW